METDVVAVEEQIDEGAQPPFGVEQLVAEQRKRIDQPVERSPDGSPVGGDLGAAIGEAP